MEVLGDFFECRSEVKKEVASYHTIVEMCITATEIEGVEACMTDMTQETIPRALVLPPRHPCTLGPRP